MSNINISHIAYGSLTSSIGASTLGYSENVSNHGRSVEGVFLDEYGRLSADYSSLLWQYYSDTDSYMLSHVQGHYVEDMAMARFFSYRDSSEVKRNEMLLFDFPLANVMETMPRIKYFTYKETFPSQYKLMQHRPMMGPRAHQLMQIIYYALANGLQLYVGMQTAGRSYKDNGIFESDEWNTLIEAIDLLDINLRQYITFAFCVDQNYVEHLADKVVVFYARESELSVPQDCPNIQFEDIPIFSFSDSVQKSIREDGLLFRDITAVEDGKLLSHKEFETHILKQRAIRDSILSSTKSYSDFSQEEYRMWRNMGHRIEELKASNWDELNDLLSLVGGAQSQDGSALLEFYKGIVVHWSIENMSLEKLRELKESGIVDDSRIRQQTDNLFTADLSRCTNADSIVKCVGKYTSDSFDSIIVDRIAQLTPLKDDDKIEDLLKICKKADKKLRSHSLIIEALNRMAGKKAQALGASVDQWYKFLSKLSNKKARPLSEGLYLNHVRSFDDSQRKHLAKALEEYADQHSKNAKKYTFRLIKAFVDTEKGIPVNLPERDTNKDEKTNGGDTNIDTKKTADKLNGVLKEDMFKRIIHWAIPILLLAFLIAWMIFYFSRPSRAKKDVPDVKTSSQVSVSPGDENDHLLYKLACFRPEVKKAIVNLGSKAVPLNISDISALCKFDNLYTLSETRRDTAHFSKADFVLFQWPKSESIEVKKDTIKTNGSSPFLPQVFRRQDRVHEVLVYNDNNKDTLRIDIPNTKIYDAQGEEYLSKGLSSSDYFLWLVRTIEHELTTHHNGTIHLAY